MRSLLILVSNLLFTLLAAATGGSGGPYAVSNIPGFLLKNANAVLRLEEVRFEVRNLRETKHYNHFVITILNEKGDEFADFVQPYDKYTDIESVEGTLYDSEGRQLKRVRKKDLEDRSAVSESSLMDDNRVKRHNFYYRKYPYTIEYEVETVNKSTLFFPMWLPQDNEALSVELSSYTLTCPEAYQFRYKAIHYDGEPVIKNGKNTRSSTWSISNKPAISREPYSPLWHELTTAVIFAPTNFQMDEYKGNMASWQDFGLFVHLLKKDRDQLPPAIRQEVHTLTDGLNDPRAKIVALYRYMQQHTRYINVSLGIGGWQPYDAAYVAKNGYGDCKALTNYMYSLLKEAGIKSYYTVVRAGKYAKYIISDFPSQQFNHVILCVPLAKDSLWLECTSQTLPAGYLSSFTADRYALLVDEQGGTLIRTPRYGLGQNTQVRNIHATLEDNGTLQVKAANRYSALEQDDIHDMINYLSQDKVREFLRSQMSFATYDINDFHYQEEPGMIPAVEETLDITVSNYASITGKRVFIAPNIMTKSGSLLGMDSARKYEIVLGDEYRNIDSVEIVLPNDYEPEAIPTDIKLKSKFGNYTSSISLRGNKLIYYRRMEHLGGRYPASDYTDLVKFYQDIYKADRNRIVLLKK